MERREEKRRKEKREQKREGLNKYICLCVVLLRVEGERERKIG